MRAFVWGEFRRVMIFIPMCLVEFGDLSECEGGCEEYLLFCGVCCASRSGAFVRFSC